MGLAALCLAPLGSAWGAGVGAVPVFALVLSYQMKGPDQEPPALRYERAEKMDVLRAYLAIVVGYSSVLIGGKLIAFGLVVRTTALAIGWCEVWI